MIFFVFSTFRDFVIKDHFPRFARFCGSVCQFFSDGFSIILASTQTLVRTHTIFQ